MNRWYEYVIRTAGTERQTHIEAKSGIGQSTLSKWKSGTQPTAAQAAKFALAYDDNPVAAFVAAGWITWEEAGLPPRTQPVEHLSNQDLIRELAYRLPEEFEDGRPTSADLAEAHDDHWVETLALAANDEDHSIDDEAEGAADQT